MKNIFQVSLWIVSIFLALLLCISFALTQKKFNSFLLKSYLDSDPNFIIEESNWHPLKPSILIGSFESKAQSQIILADEILIEFSLISIFRGKFISRLGINGVTIQSQNIEKDPDLFSLFGSLKTIEELNINSLKINLPDGSNLFNLSLHSLFDERGPKLNLHLKDKETNILEIGILSNENSKGELVRGYIQTNKFLIDEAIINLICKLCQFSGELNTKLNFTFLRNKPLSFEGNMDFYLNKDVFSFNSISSSFRLKNHIDEYLQVSAILNKDNTLKVPDFFVNLSGKDTRLIFPKFVFSNSKLTDTILESLGLKLDVDGFLEDVSINLDSNKEILIAKLQDLKVKHNSIDLAGFNGQLSVFKDKAEVAVNSPLLRISTHGFLDKNLEFYDFNSFLNLDFSKNNIELIPSSFFAILNKQRVEGLLSISNIPTKGAGDISLRIRNEKMNEKSALSLFPNTYYLASTKKSIDSLIESGFFEDINFIYRGPVDGRYIDNSSSFAMQGSGRDMIINLNEFKISGIDTNFSINNFNINGKLTNGKFFGSEVEANFNTYQSGKGLSLDITGNSFGPVSSLVELVSYDIGKITTGGFHETNFYYSSPIENVLSLLGKKSRLEISTDIKKGEFNLLDLGFEFQNIYSSLNYNNVTGFDEGYFSFKLNSIPLIFELNEDSKTVDYTFFKSDKPIQIRNLFPASIRDSASGSSATLIQVAIPSLIRGQNIERSYINLTSDLLGTKINLPDPFFKAKDDPTELNLTFYPPFAEETSRLRFKLGEIMRGKFNLSNEVIEGFIIAGKEKQSISIEKDKISLIGNIKSLDLAIFNSFEKSINTKIVDLDIKKLEINKLILSNFSLPRTIVRSKNSNQFLELLVSNQNLKGSFYLPKITNRVPIIDLDFVNLNFSEFDNAPFADANNNLLPPLKFKTNSLVINSIDYGNWAFDLSSSNSAFSLDNIEGTYGKWGLTRNKNNISSLKIFKTQKNWKTTLESKIYSGSPEKAFKQVGIDPNFEMDTISAETKISWQSLPWQFDYGMVTGDVSFDIEGLLILNGEDLQAQSNILRLLSIFNITDSFEKVTNLDFRKLYKSGFSADTVQGNLLITKNLIRLKKPMIFKSGSSEFKWEGEIKRDKTGKLDDLDLEVVMTLPLRDYLPAYAFLLGGPVTAGVVYIAGKAFERDLDKLSSGSWTINGSIEEPNTEFNGWFEQ